MTVADLAGYRSEDDQCRTWASATTPTDEVTISATPSADTITVAGGKVSGLSAQTTVAPAQLRERLALNGLDGADSIDSAGVPATGIRIESDGGARR